MLDGIFPRKTTAEWLQELNGADILATEVVAHQAEPTPEHGQHTEEMLLERAIRGRRSAPCATPGSCNAAGRPRIRY